MKQLLELICTRVRLGVMFSLSPTAASSISAILRYLCVRLFNVPLLLLFPLSALALQGGALLAAGRIAAVAVQLIPVVVVLAAVINAPLPLPSPRCAGGCHIARPLMHCCHCSNKGVGAATPKGVRNVGLGDGQRGWGHVATLVVAAEVPLPRRSPCLSLPGHPKGVVFPHHRHN
jgi:hypothetical protein